MALAWVPTSSIYPSMPSASGSNELNQSFKAVSSLASFLLASAIKLLYRSSSFSALAYLTSISPISWLSRLSLPFPMLIFEFFSFSIISSTSLSSCSFYPVNGWICFSKSSNVAFISFIFFRMSWISGWWTSLSPSSFKGWMSSMS